MDFLEDTFGAETSPVTLTDLVGEALPPAQIPKSSIRNRAATTALMSSDPSKAVEDYQLLMKEGEERQNAVYEQLKQKTLADVNKTDMQGVMSVLSDPSVPFDQKRKLVSGVKGSDFLKDSATILHTNSLVAESKGENREQENSRISAADSLGEIYRARTQIQGLVNAHGASLDSASISTASDMAALYILPFGNNLAVGELAAKVAKAEGKKVTFWDTVKSFLLPGTATADMKGKLESLPPEKRVEYAKALISGIKSNEGILFSSDNQFTQFEKATQIFEEGGYSTFDKWLDNITPLLDVVGIGEVIRGTRSTTKAIKATEKGVQEATVATGSLPPSYAPKIVSREDLTTVTGKPTAGAFDDKIAKLEAEKADLLGVAGNLAERGTVSDLLKQKKDLIAPPKLGERAKEIQSAEGIISKEAKSKAAIEIADAQAEYDARISRIDSLITSNKEAATATQKISDLEKKIALLQERNTPIFLKKTPIADMIERIERNSIIRRENPAAPANIFQQSNPEKARAIHEMVFKSSTDEVAEAMYGTSKVQAIINDVYPQVATSSGHVTAKVPDISRNLRKELQISDELIGMMGEFGGTNYTKGEIASARAHVMNDFAAAEGLTMNEAMSSFMPDGSRFKISAMYGTPEGGFLKASDALKQAEYAMSNRGVLPEELTLMKRQGLDYVPTTLEEVAGKDGSYMVRLDTFHDISPSDVRNWDITDVKRNWFDRVGPLVTQSKGSVSRYLFDASSMLHPSITGAAIVANDATAKFDKFMLTVASEFSDKYMKLKAERKGKIDDYIREANFNGIKMDDADLVVRGFQPEEVSALKSWKKFWDGHFYLENYDVVKTMNAQGFQLFKNPTTELYAKRIEKNQNIGAIYDPATDTVIKHSKAEGDALYNSGGTYAKLKRPTDFNGSTAEYMIVRNTPTEYLRTFRPTDQVLNYRNGYFQLQYKAPKFVDEITRDVKGSVVSTKTVAVGGDTQEAKFFADRMASTTGKEYTVRSDVRTLQRGSDEWWDLNSASGRIAQRHRGKLLEDASGLNHLGDGSYILNPVESAIRSAKSIAGRTVNRPMLEAAKARFIANRADVLPPNGIGGKRWPSNVDEIGKKGELTSEEVSDARTEYEYINSLENGYLNSIDDVFKWGFNSIADALGKAGLAKSERGVRAISEVSPTSVGKGAVFMAYIGSNVLRQWIIQPHQILRTFAYNPQGWANGGIPYLAAGYLGGKAELPWLFNKFGKLSNNLGSVFGVKRPHLDIDAFTKFLDNSGLLDAVDKNNLVRGTLTAAAEGSSRLTRVAMSPLEFTRRVGFDLGEQANLIGHAAAVYERRTRLGVDLSNKTLRDEACSEIRAISYDMNFAGDMPYNQTSPSIVLQFLQVPHKAFLQMTNRRISGTLDPTKGSFYNISTNDKLRMAAADLIMWGGPTTLVSTMVGKDVLPDDPFWRETFVWGLESALLNKTLTDITGERVSIDFSSLAPYDSTGWTKFFSAVWEEGSSTVITNSPAGQLFLKDGGRVQTAIKSMGRLFGIVEDMDETPETFLQTMNEVMKISSGWNSALKAKILLDAKKRYDQYGVVIDQKVGYVEAWAQALGFSTSDTRDLYRISMEMSKDTKKHKEDVMQVYQDTKRYYAAQMDAGVEDLQFMTKVTGRLLKVFEQDPAALDIIQKEWSKDLQGKEAQLFNTFLKRANIPNLGNLKDQVRQMPVSDEQKKLMMQIIEDTANARAEYKKD